MKVIKIILFLFIIQCAGPLNKVEKVYICGDHKCANKAEAEEYFNNNISIEIYSYLSADANPLVKIYSFVG